MNTKGWSSLWVVVALLMLAALIAGCGSSASSAAEGGDVVLDREDMGKQVVLQEGQALVVTLDANPSTGYRWDVAEPEDAVLSLVGEPEFESGAEGQGDLVGAPGMQTLRFEAKDRGKTTLTLVYHRPWETDVEPLETLMVEVEVR
ncbi:MAG: protease inhibitor I42 family protein [Anaerolineae bacterium]